MKRCRGIANRHHRGVNIFGHAVAFIDGLDAIVNADAAALASVALIEGGHTAALVGVLVIVAGGVMPDDDAGALMKMGVAEVMLQDTPPQAIIDKLERLVEQRGPR